MLHVLIFLDSLGARATRAMCRCRADLVFENLALRQQVTALKKKRPRPPLEDIEPVVAFGKIVLVDVDELTRIFKGPRARRGQRIAPAAHNECSRCRLQTPSSQALSSTPPIRITLDDYCSSCGSLVLVSQAGLCALLGSPGVMSTPSGGFGGIAGHASRSALVCLTTM